MATPLTDVVQDYAKLASSLLERWTEHASMVASKLDAGSYDADGAAADLAATASLATESWFLLAAEALDAAAILTGRQHRPHLVHSTLFSTSLAGATLELPGPLVSGHGAQLPVSVITLEPAELDPAETDFSLSADATGHRSGTYVGTVEASASGQVEPVRVWIIVP
jgi:hypothetical protein